MRSVAPAVSGSHAAQQGNGAVRSQVTAGATSNGWVSTMWSLLTSVGFHQIVAVFDEGNVLLSRNRSQRY
jgi:hypothetical protein